jgi:GH24 family phage-related lysozyme (muramidase)
VKPAVEAGFVGFSAPLEGVVRWMYLDVKGLVTVAIGNLIDPVSMAFDVPFVWPDGRAATRSEIQHEWLKVKRTTTLARSGYRAAERVSELRLTDDGVEALVSRVLHRFDAELVRRYPAFDSWPADAQMATLAMAWACGTGFGRTFKLLDAALKRGDWATASQQCHINEIGNPGVIPRNKAMKQLYFLAAALPCDGDELHWPADEQVRQWQAQRGLVPDGLVGPKTIGALT